MTFDKQIFKRRSCILVCCCFVLLIYVDINYIAILQLNSFKKLFILSSPYSETVTLVNPIKKPIFHMNSIPNEAFVTFSDNNPTYLALLKNLLESVHYFSTRPIIAYGIDVDLNINVSQYPRLIKRRLKKSDCGPSIFFCKILAIIDSKLDYGVHLEADSVVNWNVDVLFDVVHQWPYPLPLAPRHPDDPVNYLGFLEKLGVKSDERITPYIHAQFSWNYRAYPFFEEALKYMRENYFNGANFDETGMNVVLWKWKANHTLCKIDPYHTYLRDYESNETKCKQYCHTAFILLHGSKDVDELRNVFERLKKRAGSPYILTVDDGLHYLNETQYTCCYPDSKPSPIHPLLCEYSKKIP